MNKIKIFLPVFLLVVVGMLALSSCEKEMFLCLTPSVKNMNDFENRFTSQYAAGQEDDIEELFNIYGF